MLNFSAISGYIIEYNLKYKLVFFLSGLLYAKYTKCILEEISDLKIEVINRLEVSLH